MKFILLMKIVVGGEESVTIWGKKPALPSRVSRARRPTPSAVQRPPQPLLGNKLRLRFSENFATLAVQEGRWEANKQQKKSFPASRDRHDHERLNHSQSGELEHEKQALACFCLASFGEGTFARIEITDDSWRPPG